jgi:phenylacetate-CoA ligase
MENVRVNSDAMAEACGIVNRMTSDQVRRLESMLAHTYRRNPFYTKKFRESRLAVPDLRFPEDLEKLPLTTKAELVADQAAHPPWGSALSEPVERYTRYCQTSSTSGTPLRWLDTNENWDWLVNCWKEVYHAARVGPGDRIFLPFSFGPFLGFWLAFEAAPRIGALAVPGGGMSSEVRLAMIDKIRATVVCCTPTYALWLAELAGQSLTQNSVRVLIVAGEPGGSIRATREMIERSWGARVIDHHGLSEVGPISFECWENPGGLHINEDAFVCEVLDPGTGQPLGDGQHGELVVTNLGRTASPLIRYRTGDIVVRRAGLCPCGRTSARLEGGILARADDMINIRGVNVYPAAIESVVRQFPEIIEFRSTASRRGAMWELSIEIEPASEVTDLLALESKLSRQLNEALGLTIPVRTVDAGVLPRFEMKARRFEVRSDG